MNTTDLKELLFGTRPVISIALSQTEGALKHVLDSLIPQREKLEERSRKGQSVPGGLHTVLLVEYRYVFRANLPCREAREHLLKSAMLEVEFDSNTYYLNAAGARTLYRAVRNLYAPRARMEGFTPQGDVLYYAMAAGESLATIDICKQPMPGVIAAA